MTNKEFLNIVEKALSRKLTSACREMDKCKEPGTKRDLIAERMIAYESCVLTIRHIYETHKIGR